MIPMQRSYLGLKGRPVSSIEEVKAASIDFDGSVFFFPDLANKRIYTKYINMDGTLGYGVYELRTENLEQASPYVTREEFEQAIQTLTKTLAPVPVQPVAAPAPSPNTEFTF